MTMQRLQQRYHRSIVIPTMTTFSNIDKSPRLSPLLNTRTTTIIATIIVTITTIMQVYRRKFRKRRTESRKREIKSLLFANSNHSHHQQHQSSLFHNNHNNNFLKRECEKKQVATCLEWENEKSVWSVTSSSVCCWVFNDILSNGVNGFNWTLHSSRERTTANEESCSLHVNEFWTFWPKMVIYNYPTDDNGQTSNKFWTCALFRSGGTQQRKFPGAHTSSDTKKCGASLDVWHLWTFKGFVVKRSSLHNDKHATMSAEIIDVMLVDRGEGDCQAGPFRTLQQ